jgi:hypothetical protein
MMRLFFDSRIDLFRRAPLREVSARLLLDEMVEASRFLRSPWVVISKLFFEIISAVEIGEMVLLKLLLLSPSEVNLVELLVRLVRFSDMFLPLMMEPELMRVAPGEDVGEFIVRSDLAKITEFVARDPSPQPSPSRGEGVKPSCPLVFKLK